MIYWVLIFNISKFDFSTKPSSKEKLIVSFFMTTVDTVYNFPIPWMYSQIKTNLGNTSDLVEFISKLEIPWDSTYAVNVNLGKSR